MNYFPELLQQGGRLVVTGGTGSFGHAVATAVACSPYKQLWEVVVLSRDERKQALMRERYPQIEYIVGDVRDYDAVRRAFTDATHVFHAAALKQVPSCEQFPEEALATNCLGALNVKRAAIDAGVLVVIALSTDKAVMPLNAMGISKAMAERIFCAPTPHSARGAKRLQWPRFTVVRYGNVLGTRGSVLPVWKEALKHGSIPMITDPAMTRFVMNLSDALSLVGFAATKGRHRHTYVQLAKAVQMGEFYEAAMHVLGRDVATTPPPRQGGYRPGEKQHEVLISAEEGRRARPRGLSANDTPPFAEIAPSDTDECAPPKPFGPYSSATAHHLGSAELLPMLRVALKEMEEAL